MVQLAMIINQVKDNAENLGVPGKIVSPTDLDTTANQNIVGVGVVTGNIKTVSPSANNAKITKHHKKPVVAGDPDKAVNLKLPPLPDPLVSLRKRHRAVINLSSQMSRPARM